MDPIPSQINPINGLTSFSMYFTIVLPPTQMISSIQVFYLNFCLNFPSSIHVICSVSLIQSEIKFKKIIICVKYRSINFLGLRKLGMSVSCFVFNFRYWLQIFEQSEDVPWPRPLVTGHDYTSPFCLSFSNAFLLILVLRIHFRLLPFLALGLTSCKEFSSKR